MQAGSKLCIAKLTIALQACPRDKLNVKKQLEQTKNNLQVIPIIVVVSFDKDIAAMSLLNVQCSS